MTNDDIVDLCTRLRLLGATEVQVSDTVHGPGFHAKFQGVARAAPTTPKPDPEAKPLTPEQAREAQRRRELGR